jgi:hypothetical protein
MMLEAFFAYAPQYMRSTTSSRGAAVLAEAVLTTTSLILDTKNSAEYKSYKSAPFST